LKYNRPLLNALSKTLKDKCAQNDGNGMLISKGTSFLAALGTGAANFLQVQSS
jgi:hypothetical protein